MIDTFGTTAPFLVVAAGLLALPTTALLLRRYRRSLVRLMAARGVDDAGSGRSADPPAESTPAGVPAEVPAELHRRLIRRLAGHVAITVGAGLFVGLTYAALFVVWNDLEPDLVQYSFLALMFSWPAIPGVWVSTDGDRRWTLAACVVYLAAVLVVSGLGRSGALAGLVAWGWFNALPTLVVAVFFTRAFRAVGICVLGLVLAGLVGAQASLTALDSDAFARLVVEAGAIAGVRSASALVVAAGAAGFVLASAVGWWAFSRVGRWYTRHLFSDHMLLLGSLCFVFCADYVAVVAASDPRALAIGLTLFAALAIGSVIVYRTTVGSRTQPARLLLLRVFDHGPDGPRLLNAISARWRFVGPVRLIAGPDLASSTIEPDEFLTFMSGGLHRLFIDTGGALDQRIAQLRPETDPDGRYRLDEFFCLDTTWRRAVDALVGRSDVVLLDLRGFTEARRGAADELDLLGRRGVFDRTVVMADRRTDFALVESIVAGTRAGRPTIVSTPEDDPDPVIDALFGQVHAIVSA